MIPSYKCSGDKLLLPLVSNGENSFDPCFVILWFNIFSIGSILWNLKLVVKLLKYGQHYGKLIAKDTGLLYFVRIFLILGHFIAWWKLCLNSFDFSIISLNLLVILVLHIIEPIYSPLPFDNLLIFWPIFQIFQIAIYYQTFTNFKILDLNLVYIFNGLVIFILEYQFYKPSHTLISFYSQNPNLKKILNYPNIIDKFTFCWMNPFIENAAKTHNLPQFPEYFPTQLSAQDSAFRFLNHYNKSVSHSDWSFVLAISKAFGKIALLSFFYELISKLLGFLQPQLLRLLIMYFQNDSPFLEGILICLLMFTLALIQTFFYNEYFLTNLELGLHCRSSLTAIIYQKSLKVSNGSTGDIVNLMSIDVNRIQSITQDISTLILAPTDIFICILSLWPLLGKATFSGIVTMVLLLPINSLIVKKSKKLNKTQMKLKDKRSKAIQEILMSMKSIKLFGWEKAMLKKVSDIRNNEELVNLKKIRLINQLANFIWNIIPFLVAFTSFSAFALTSDIPLTSDIVFPSLALLNLLSTPLLSLPQVITSMIEASVSLARINKFLRLEELDPNLVEYTSDNSVSITGSFSWGDKEVLHDINVVVYPKEFYCFVGKVGSGKSSLLSAILGQLKIVNDGSIKIGGSIAYCEQLPWIMNASVKENITFGHRWDPDFYYQTLESCQLTQDLQILHEGDETLVGEKGVSLSGGQKARVALARAVYSRADIYVLDDILSAVDSHVGKKLIEEVLLGLLRGRTVIMSTNSISVLKYADKISLMENGTIIETVTSIDIEPEDHPKLFHLLQEFGNNVCEDISTTSSSISELKLTRKASIETFSWEPLQRLLPKSNSQAEVSAKGKVKWEVYLEFFKATSVPGVALWFITMVLASFLSVSANYWLKNWTEHNSNSGKNSDVWRFIAVYAIFGMSSALVRVLSTSIMQLWLAIRASTIFHNRMAFSILYSPISFFENNPSGRIMNRFTNDINKIDSSISGVFAGFFSRLVSTGFTLGVVGYVMPPFILIIVLLSVIYIYYEICYVSASRELKRLVSISRSPIYAHLGESLNGIDTIRAFKQHSRFTFINHANIDFNIQAVYMLRSINRWLYYRLQLIGSIGILCASTLAVLTSLTAHPLSASLAGFVMTYAMQVTTSLKMVVRMSVELEVNVVAVERCLEYCQLPTEKLDGLSPPATWPDQGCIKFQDFYVKYRPNLEYVLKNINLSIQSGEKIGVVGRTGSGKSTFALSIFRIIEACKGSIIIDDLITSGVRLEDLRHRLSTIPQDSQLIAGSLRQNLDPFEYYKDEEIWQALSLAHLKDTVENLEDKLDFQIEENGANFSQGQRQLISLTRVLLKMNQCKILVLDEATASVDVQTDRLIQQTIRSQFHDKTIITIAHRLDTVMDSDKILSLDLGEIKEFDSPQRLLQNPDGIFYTLCKQGGHV